MRRFVVCAAIAAVAFAGCGGSGNSSKSSSTPAATKTATETATQAPASGSATKLAVKADPSGALKFTESSLTTKAGKVEIDFSNPAQLPHAVAIEGNGIKTQTTETVTGADAPPITVDLKPGTYTFYCPVDGHRAAGMEGKLTVK